MRFVMFVMMVASLLLAAPVRAEPPASFKVRLECFDAWKSHDLREAGGGPGGAHWNTDTIVCAVNVEPIALPEMHSVRIRLQLGQGKVLALAGELFSPAHPRQLLAMGEERPEVEALASVGANKPGFFVPASLFASVLRQKSRQAQTGASVHRVRFLVTATGLDLQGRPVATARDEIQAEFASGE